MPSRARCAPAWKAMTSTGAVVPPIHLSATYAFRGYGEKRAYDYSRSGNPTRDLLGAALAELEGGAGAVITASGMAAVTLCLQVLPARARMRGAARLLRRHLPAVRCAASARRHRGRVRRISATTRRCAPRCRKPAALLWIETPSNPLLRLTDIARGRAARPGRRRAGGGRQHLPVAGLAAAAAVSAPTWWCIRPPSTSTATATWSAAR